MSEVRDLLDVAEQVRHEGEQLTPTDCEWDTVDDVNVALDIWRQAKIQEAAAGQITRAAGERLSVLLGEGGAIGYGDSIVRYRMQRVERCHDPEGFIDYLTLLVKTDDVHLGDVINPDAAKKSWMDDSVRDTFYEWHDKEPGLTIVPKSKAPAWLQDLPDGEVAGRLGAQYRDPHGWGDHPPIESTDL